MKDEFRNILLAKMIAYCNYRERCTKEVENKIAEIDSENKYGEYLFNCLSEGEYFNDQLFANSFASGKFRMKSWGKSKIKSHLNMKKLDKEIIDEAIDKIDQQEYYEKAKELIIRKIGEQKIDFSLKQKILRSMFQKGYNSELVLDIFYTLETAIID